MTVKKYLKQISRLFNAKRIECENKKQCMQKVLKKLHKRKQLLKKQLKQEKSAKEIAQLKKSLVIVCTQQKKGIVLLKELRKR